MGTLRILHLLDQDAEFEAERGAAGLSRALGEGFDVERRTIGAGGGDLRDVPTAVASLRRQKQSFDIIHAWGGRALAAATLGTHTRVVFSPGPLSSRRTIGWLRAIMAYRDVQVVCATATMRRRMVESGVTLERCHLIRPGVDFGRIKRRRDPSLRAELGLAETDAVVLAPGESTPPMRHDVSLWATTVLHVADPKYTLLTWGRGPGVQRVKNLAAGLGQLASMRVAREKLGRDIEFEDLLSAADLVLINATGPVATLPIAASMAAGLPIVAYTSYTVGELLEDRHNALMLGSNNPRRVAQRVLDLVNDPSVQWKVADMARTEAYEFFSFTRFVSQFRTVYRQFAANEKVEVPEEAPKAGARFHSLGAR